MNYYSDLISDAGSDCHAIFKSIDRLLHLTPEKKLPSAPSSLDLANTFVDFFRDKIVNIRNGFPKSLNYAPIYTVPDLVLCECDCRFDSFYPVSLDELSLISRKLMSKSCELDPLPAGLLQDTSVTLLPVICKIVNASLKNGSVCLKTGVIKPT